MAALVVGVIIGGTVGWVASRRSATTKAVISAREFCALGEDEGASLLDVAGWAKASQRVNDWDAVRREINRQCPEWRDQVVAKSGSLNGP